jgi:uncharacterized protein YjlB
MIKLVLLKNGDAVTCENNFPVEVYKKIVSQVIGRVIRAEIAFTMNHFVTESRTQIIKFHMMIQNAVQIATRDIRSCEAEDRCRG